MHRHNARKARNREGVGMNTVGSQLLREIERVSAKRERWRGYAAAMQPLEAVGLTLSINDMTAEIEEAKDALLSEDPASAIRALEALRGYDDQ
jgi:hypothetical protein